MTIRQTTGMFLTAAIGLLLAGCPNNGANNGANIGAAPQVTASAQQADAGAATLAPTTITSGDEFVGIWTVTTICALPANGTPKRHYEVGHGASSWAHLNNNSTYAIYKKSGSGASAIYGMMISEEFANYEDPGKQALIEWNASELHFVEGDGEYHTGDACVLPVEGVAMLKTEISGGGSPRRPVLHASKDHEVQFWLYKDSSGNIRPVMSFEHWDGVAPIHRGLIH